MEEIRFAVKKISNKPGRFVAVFLVTAWLFFYLTNLELFFAIVGNSVLPAADKLRFLVDSFLNIFRYITDIRVLSVVVFSFIAAVNFILMREVYKRKSAMRGKTSSAVAGSAITLIGSHCIACGGSLVAPLITTIAGSGAFLSTARVNTSIFLSVAVNIVGIVIISVATKKMIKQEMALFGRASH